MGGPRTWDAVVVGAGPAGLSAAIYLSRSLRDVIVVHHGRPMAIWEPEIQNYLGFLYGVSGEELLATGRAQAERYGAVFAEADVCHVVRAGRHLIVGAGKRHWHARRALLGTGTHHRLPDVPGVAACLGRSLFFCKDCDAWRVRGKTIAIIGRNDDAMEYALALLAYSPRPVIATNGEAPTWDDQHDRLVRAQAIARELFEEDLARGAVKRARLVQFKRAETLPEVLG